MVDLTSRAALRAALVLVLVSGANAQYNERPDAVGSGSAAVDCSGRSIKNPRVRAIHAEDPDRIGGTAYFLERDPFLAYQLGRNLNLREFRTRDGVFNPDVGGVGSGFPWGHDGRSLTLEDAILRHDGDGAASKAAWLAAGNGPREKVLNILRKLVLYDVESLPADIDGDGQIASDLTVAGVSTGPERFNAEWRFETPAQIQGYANVGGEKVRSFAALNLAAAYGLGLPLRKDSDLDGWPDVWDHAPFGPGYGDGER